MCIRDRLNDAQNAAIESEKGNKTNLKNGLVAGFSTGTSVSYTHLDVYKRQSLARMIMFYYRAF